MHMSLFNLHIKWLKLPYLFPTWCFWTFHNKSHNMKALFILSHPRSQFLPLTYLYGKYELLWVSVHPSGVFFVRKNFPSDYPFKSHDYDNQCAELIMVWLPYDRRKCEHNGVRLVWEFDCLQFTQFIPMSPHGIGYKQTWYPPDVREWWETVTKLFLSDIINHGESDVQWQISI